MKKIVYSILVSIFLLYLAGCDKSHLCSFDIVCSNENVNIVVEGESYDSFNFSSDDLNGQPLDSYSYINFTGSENDSSNNAKMHKFEIVSLVNETYNLSLKLVDANKYVVDFLRVAIIIENELRVYKYYDKKEDIFHKENDPDSILHFNSKSEIFNELTIDLSAGESKKIIIFIWIEEAELYDNNGERYTGWADKSYDASPIMLDMEVK